MLSIFSEAAAGLVELQTELGDECPTITWQGQTIKVLPGGITLKSKNSAGGMSLDSDFSFTCLAADFGSALPSSNQLLAFAGNPLKIESVVMAMGGRQLEIRANHAYQGA